jgi:hypothetical protein
MKIYYPDIIALYNLKLELRWIKFCFEIDLEEFMKTQARILILIEPFWVHTSHYKLNIMVVLKNVIFKLLHSWHEKKYVLKQNLQIHCVYQVTLGLQSCVWQTISRKIKQNNILAQVFLKC